MFFSRRRKSLLSKWAFAGNFNFMKTNGKTKRTELGRFVVADPEVCHGKPTFKGMRIMVWQLFEHLALGEPLEDFPKHFPGRVSLEAAREALEPGEDCQSEEAGKMNRN
jgi:uncharacterized protein (DUF433 family)